VHVNGAVATEEHEVMAVRLNRQAFEHAKDLITKGMFVADRRDAWSEHQPSSADENDFIRMHGYDEAESRAGQYKHYDIENAAAHLHGMIDASQRQAAGIRHESP
jgi:hypothetical protein